MESICKCIILLRHLTSIDKLFLVPVKILLFVFFSVYAFPDIIMHLIRRHKKCNTGAEYFNVITV